jgi:hypothetical protein
MQCDPVGTTRFFDRRLAIALIVLASLAVKLAFILLVGGGLSEFPSEGTDNAFYYNTALNLLETGVYGNQPGVPTVGMPPGQPAFLALLYMVGGKSLVLAKLAQVLLLTAVAVRPTSPSHTSSAPVSASGRAC